LTDAAFFWQRLQKYGTEDEALSTTTSSQTRKISLFIMMALQLAIWGPGRRIVPLHGHARFFRRTTGTCRLVLGHCLGRGHLFSNQFADRNFSAERFWRPAT
jgi:hypothetical protein